MTEVNEWQVFFDNQAHEYMRQWFTQNWMQEVDFILQELGLPQGSRILDVGCGTGRHSVEMARRGYKVTGLDFSTGMLAEAQKAAQLAGAEVEWIYGDATQFATNEPYDGAICMLEAAFALLTPRQNAVEHDMAVLHSVNAALKVGARFILEAPSALRLIRHMSPDDIENGSFNPLTMVYTGESTWETPEGVEEGIITSTRSYVPPELAMYLYQSNFSVVCMSGSSSARTSITTDAYTLVIVAEKVADLPGAK
jgi:SAM-dependent methyltransferase